MRKTRRRKAGSALITAMIFSTVVAGLTASYLYLSTSEYKLASRSFFMNAGFNLAEGGLELALDALNDDDFSGWTPGADDEGDIYYKREFDDYNLGGNASGKVKVLILKAETSAPAIYAEGVASRGDHYEIRKQMHIDARSGYFPFKNGFNSKEGIVLSGNNVTFDSYDSRDGPYGPGNKNSEVTVSTVSIDVDAVDVGNADIYGYVATGGAPPDVGPNGSVTDYANPGVVDESRVTTDFYAEFPKPAEPDMTAPLATFPNDGTVAGGDYRISGDWKSSGGNVLEIAGDTRVYAEDDMEMSGKAEIRIADGASLELYVEGDVDLSGNGVLNDSQIPSEFLVFGMAGSPGDQRVKVSGNGYLAGAVYAPNANVEIKGGGTDGRVYGSVVGYDADVTGNSHFSYDEALAELNIGGGDYAAENWSELSGFATQDEQVDFSNYGL